jgi:hypothetical protein
MKDQVLDIWADLRDRRLWPVAALLLLCLVAVPVVLIKPAEEAPSKAATPTAGTANGDPLAKQAVVQAFDAKPLVKISNLDQFAAKDPFKPIEQLKPLSASDVVATTGNGSGAQPGAGAGAGGESGGGAAGGATPDGNSGGGGGGGVTQPVQPSPAPKTKKFTYVVDLSFGHDSDVQRYQSFGRLGMLPSENSPLLVYLGVDGTGTQAAFLVDSSLSATGEGHCKPSPSTCGVVYLEPGEKETFDDGQGHQYELVIDQVRKVEVKAKGAKAGKAGRPTASTADGQPRRFLFPVLIDLETGVHP